MYGVGFLNYRSRVEGIRIQIMVLTVVSIICITRISVALGCTVL